MKSHSTLNLSHLIQYALLIIILVIGIVIYLSVPSFTLKLITAGTLALIYPVWGIWHHWEHHQHFSFGVVVEYLLVSLLIVVVLVSLTG